jgi:hypothetical protein
LTIEWKLIAFESPPYLQGIQKGILLVIKEGFIIGNYVILCKRDNNSYIAF